jgi:23S rRNA (guanosine2251-2'-O)-methyltransferase
MEIIYGRHPISEAIRGKRKFKKIFIAKDSKGEAIDSIISNARDSKIKIEFVDKKQLDRMTKNANHQGAVAEIESRGYSNFDDVLISLESKPDALIIMLDRITDPHNLGAIIRSAHLLGADAVIISKRESAGITNTVAKTSAGAVEYIPIIQVVNLANTVDILEKKGFWILGADAGGKSCFDQRMRGKIVLIMGSEGEGMKRLLKDKCDLIISIPLSGKIDSLNVSCAASILIYEILRQKSK